MSIIIGTFDHQEAAERAVQEIRDKGITEEEISIVAREDAIEQVGDDEGGLEARQDEAGGEDMAFGEDDITYGDQDVSDGAMTGGAIGVIGGLLAGAGALAIPGVGPIVAAGPIAAGLSGAAAGGIAGGLIDLGIPEEKGRDYEEEVRQGNILTIVHSDENTVQDVANIFRRHGARRVESH